MIWSYKSKRMCRDYVLGTPPFQIHIEAKHRWSGWRGVDQVLKQVNGNDFRGTEKDGYKKDLALLIWGAQSCGVDAAAVIDESRIAVFARSKDGWRVAGETRLDDFAGVMKLSELLKPRGSKKSCHHVK
jgi:hypothetical protein